jgi:serine/threonine protein phosphatase PrpC
MSFLSKLFRGGAPAQGEDTPEPNEQARVAADGQPADAVADSQGETALEQPDAAPPTEESTASEAQGTPPAEEQPWWAEESAETTVTDAPILGDTQAAPAESALAAVEEHADVERTADVESTPIDEGTRPLGETEMPTVAPLRSPRGLAAAAQRDIGRVRSINQDSVFSLLTTLPREGSEISLGLFIVADGMGGHDGGEIASRIAVTTVARAVLSELVIPALADNVTEALQPLIITAVQEANRAIWEHAQAIGSDMGTTCTVALLLGHALYIGHVGDSRAYLTTPTGARVLTNDHSAVGRLIQVGQLDPSEARDHPMRSQLYRTVGQHPEVQVDFVYQPLGDATHLLLCSDGLWGLLDDEILLDALNHSLWPQDACRELIARANLAGGDDNISAIVVSLPSSGQ